MVNRLLGILVSLWLFACGSVSGEPILEKNASGANCPLGTQDGGGPVTSWACAAELVPNGTIDLQDLSQLLSQIGCDRGAGNLECDSADLSFDCRVDLDDADILSAVFDTDCASAVQAPEYWPCLADVDKDKAVDSADESAVQSHQGCSVGSGDTLCDACDIDLDSAVTTDDRSIVNALLGRKCP